MQFTIRSAVPADADACAEIHVAAWEGSYRGIMPDEEFEKRPLSARRMQWRYLAMLYLRPDMKGRGLGKELLLAIAREMQTQGAKNMVLRTLRLNPARRFYEKLGARCIPEGMDFHGGVFDDVVYAFDDLSALIASNKSFSP